MRDSEFVRAKRYMRDSFPMIASLGVLGPPLAESYTDSELARNIHAVGIGNKIKAEQDTGQPAVRVYVVHKVRDLENIPGRHRIPPEINGIPTDVIESTPSTLAECNDLEFRKIQRPVVGGVSGSHVAVDQGTVGCLCRSTLPGEEDFNCVLSCNHVFGNLNSALPGDDLVQPSQREVCPPETFAKFLRLVQIKGNQPNEVDAAIGRLLVPMTNAVFGIGGITGVSQPAHKMEVVKHGRTTGPTQGTITDLSYDHLVEVVPHSGRFIEFIDQLRIEPTDTTRPFVELGDSGSIVLGPGNRVVGLLFAKDRDEKGSYAVCNRIGRVEELLNIKIAV